MNLYGYLKQIVSLWYKKDTFDIKIEPKATDTFSANTTISIPKPDAATDDFALVDTTQTLTNKRLTLPKINENVQLTATATELNQLDGVTIGGTGGTDVVTLAGIQTLTNKTIDADSNTITNIENADIKAGAAIARNKLANGTASHVLINDGSGVMSSEATLAKSRGGTAQDNSGLTFPASGEIVEKDATQTLTNKTLTSPTINTATISTPILTGGTINNTQIGNAIPNSGNFTTLTATSGTIGGSDLLTTDNTKVVTNKTIDADSNTITNIENADIKAGAAIARNKLASGTASHVIINDGSGVMISEAQLAKVRGGTGQDNSSLTFPASGTIVEKDDSQTLTNKTIDGDSNTVQDLALISLKTNLTDASKFLVRDVAGVVISNSKAVPSGDVIGSSDSQILTNKTINSDNNSISNIVDSNIKATAAIDRTKIASGTASHVIINNGSGVLSSEATLAKSRGGTGADNSSVTFPSSGTIVTTTASEGLSNKTITSSTINSTSIGATVQSSGNFTDLQCDTIAKDGGATLTLPATRGTNNYVLSMINITTGEMGWASNAPAGALTNLNVWIGNASNLPAATDTSILGDISADPSTGLNIKANVIVDNDVSNSAAIAITKLAIGSANTVLRTNSGGTANEFSLLAPTNINPSTANYVLKTNSAGTANEFGTLTNDSINASAAIAITKLATSTANYVLKVNSGGTANEFGLLNPDNINPSTADTVMKTNIGGTAVEFGKIGDANIAVAGAGADAYKVLKADATGSAIARGLIDNNNIAAAAAIAINKLAAITASRMVTSDSSGFLTTGISTADFDRIRPDVILISTDTNIATVINAAGDNKHILIAESITLNSAAMQTITVNNCWIHTSKGAFLTITASTGGLTFSGKNNLITNLDININTIGTAINTAVLVSGSLNKVIGGKVFSNLGDNAAGCLNAYRVTGTGNEVFVSAEYNGIGNFSAGSITGTDSFGIITGLSITTKGKFNVHSSNISSDLGDDSHTIYAKIAGRSGGQTLIGGTAASNNLNLESTSNATKGNVNIIAGTNLNLASGSALKFTDGGTNNISFVAGTMAGNTPYTLPTQYPSTSGESLVSTVGGTMSWATIAAIGSGFPNRTTTTISFVESTRTFTIAPTGADFYYYHNSTKYTKTSTDVIIDDVDGIHYIYFNGNTLTSSYTISMDNYITAYTPVSLVYWDATRNKLLFLADERHGLVMDSATHLYLHDTFGARYESGLALDNFVIGDGSLDTHSQFLVSDGYIHDEDIQIDIVDGTPQELSTIAYIPMYYKYGASGIWRKNRTLNTWTALTVYTADDEVNTVTDNGYVYRCTIGGTSDVVEPTWPTVIGNTVVDGSVTWTCVTYKPQAVVNFIGGSFRLAYNQFTGGVWQQTEVGSANYVLTHIFATNETLTPMIGIQGQNTYTSIALARAGANTEMNTIVTSGLPTREFKPIATVIFQTNATYASITNSRIVQTDTGTNYVDWRASQISPSVGGVDHGSLTGLADNDHPQYFLSSGALGGQTATGDTAANGNLTLASTTNGTKGYINIEAATPINFLAVSATPLIFANGDTNTGIAFAGADTLQLHTAGTNRLEINSSGNATFNNSVTISGDLTVNGTEFITNVESVEVEDNLLTINHGEIGAGVSSVYAGIAIDRGTENPYQFRFNESSDTFRIGQVYYTIVYSSLVNTFTALAEVDFVGSGAKGKIITDNGTTTMTVLLLTKVIPLATDTMAEGTATADVDTVTETDNTQAVATREDAPVDTAVPYWDAATSKFLTEAAFNYVSGTNTLNVNNLGTVAKVTNVGNIDIDAFNDAVNSTIYLKNSYGTYKANVDIENDLTVGNNITQTGLTASRVLTASAGRVLTSATMTTATLDILNDMSYNKSWSAFAAFSAGDQIYIKDDITVGANIDINADNVHIIVKPGKTVNFGDYELTISGNNVRIDNGIWEFSTASRDLITISGSRNYVNNMIVKWNDGAVNFTSAVIDIASNAQNNRGNVCIYKAGTGTVSGSEGVQDNSGKTSNTIICTIEEA